MKNIAILTGVMMAPCITAVDTASLKDWQTWEDESKEWHSMPGEASRKLSGKYTQYLNSGNTSTPGRYNIGHNRIVYFFPGGMHQLLYQDTNTEHQLRFRHIGNDLSKWKWFFKSSQPGSSKTFLMDWGVCVALSKALSNYKSGNSPQIVQYINGPLYEVDLRTRMQTKLESGEKRQLMIEDN